MLLGRSVHLKKVRTVRPWDPGFLRSLLHVIELLILGIRIAPSTALLLHLRRVPILLRSAILLLLLRGHFVHGSIDEVGVIVLTIAWHWRGRVVPELLLWCCGVHW